MKNWKKSSLLLFGLGFSVLGNWIYFVAINIIVLDMTGSPAAIAGLFVLRPLAMLITNLWSGSMIDRVNVRHLMIVVDIIRGILILGILFLSSVWSIYVLVFIINVFGAFFGPSSSVYITKAIPGEDKQRFNSMMSMINSSAFLTGPAISGLLIANVGVHVCIIINGVSFIVCAIAIFFLPDVDSNSRNVRAPLSLKMIISDLRLVIDFSKTARFFIVVYLLFQASMLIVYAIDSQEVAFIRIHLDLTEVDYGYIISVTGVGSLVGSSIAALVAKKVHYRWYLGLGLLLGTVFYIAFYASFNFLTAAASFTLLGFFMAFSGSGFTTFFQKCVPADIMGRFSSVADMSLGIVQILLTILVGVLADVISLQLSCLLFAGLAFIGSVMVCFKVLPSSRSVFFHARDKEQHSSL
ncbi:MFS transporter [Paenibacillus sp. 598K]|uniref:MFS transporter n=1 Tax=Paenibacillus sp. 598K TaxID=1117987 RepID=UPI000FFEA11E|nr:MFS transporter [Paenibacillus sp. 598K]